MASAQEKSFQLAAAGEPFEKVGFICLKVLNNLKLCLQISMDQLHNQSQRLQQLRAARYGKTGQQDSVLSTASSSATSTVNSSRIISQPLTVSYQNVGGAGEIPSGVSYN